PHNATPGARVALSEAASEAATLRSAILEPEHLLLGVLRAEVVADPAVTVGGLSESDADAARAESAALVEAFRRAGVDCKQTRRRLRQHWADTHPITQT